MNSKKLYFILLGAVILLAGGLIGGAYGANILLQGQADKLAEARSNIAALQKQQSQLAKAKADVKKYQSIGTTARSIVPQDKNQAETVRELVKIANQNGIKLANISFPSSTLGAILAPTAATTPAPISVPPVSKTNLSQLLPVKTISGLYTLQIIVQSDPTAAIPYDNFIAFLDGLEHNRRTALVSGITLQPDSKDPKKVSFTLNLDEYVKP